MLLNCGVGGDSWESLGLQGDPISPFWRRSVLGVLLCKYIYIYLCVCITESLCYTVVFNITLQFNCESKMKVLVIQSCLTLCNPMDCSSPGSSVPGILRSRTLEWVVISFSRGSSWSRDWIHISYIFCIGRQILYCCSTCEAPICSLSAL